MEDEGVREGTVKGKPCYYVFFEKGYIEITFYKSPLRYVCAESLFNDPDMEWYNGRELQQFREDYPGYFEAAKEMIADYTAKKPAKKAPAKKKAIRRSRIWL